ncbi:MAG: TrkA C-terminal domain-containing protein [Candidatus Tritonobacter lacicola]|nr:TrkA C-terminal domain-containing protein [Candidatus Tritonobacter lacicola]
MFIIVAGAGLIGSEITKKLVKNKHDVVVIDVDREEEGEFLIPRGNYVIKEADTVFLVSKSQFIKQATDLLTRVK